MTTAIDSVTSQGAPAQYLAVPLMLVFLVITAFVLYNQSFHPLARFPGPFVASFSNIWKTYHVAVGDYEHVLLALHRKYGKFVRVGPNHIDISDASAVKTIYGAGRTFKKR